MNPVPAVTEAVWETGQFVGENRPTTRITVTKDVLTNVSGTGWRTLLFQPSSPSSLDPTGGPTIPGGGSSENPLSEPSGDVPGSVVPTGGIPLGGMEYWELPNISTVTIDRRLGTDAASIRITMRNTVPPDPDTNLDLTYNETGTTPTRRELMDLGAPGHFSARRGWAVDTDGLNPWAHDQNEWADLLMPNRVLKTFQGYGTDGAGDPSQDTNLVLTGIWLIDRVELTAQGQATIEGRDLAKLLIEQKIYPPIIPVTHYPLEFCAPHTVTDTRTEVVARQTLGQQGPNVARRLQTGFDSSNAYLRGNNGPVYGHATQNAFDGSDATYWLSLGHDSPNGADSYEWITADTRGEIVNRIRFKQRYGNYKVYVSVKVDGVWQGPSSIPYNNIGTGTGNGARIKYILELNTPPGNDWITINFLDYSDQIASYYQAEEVRLTFTNLQVFSDADPPYRASIYEFRVDSFVPPVEFDEEVEVEFERPVPGNITDYTDIVKILAGLSGFLYPAAPGASGINAFDPALTRFLGGTDVGRIWGDFFYSGAYPTEPPCIPPSFWDNKSVMDGINQIKEILGFVFFIDSTGGIQWRPPNIWRTGNYMRGQGYVGETSVLTVDEKKVLIDYGVTVDDQNLRSDIIVVSADDPSVHGSFQPGWAIGETATLGGGGAAGNPTDVPGSEAVPATQFTDLSLLAGQQRVMLVANYPFGTSEDPQAAAAIQKFAFLVSLWTHWSYRKSKFRIPGTPVLEIDDQVRIYERTTSETYVHYVEGYSSTMDIEQGTWFMDVDTHWLGNGPSQQWVIRSRDMDPALFAYLRSIGQIPTEIEGDESQYPDEWYQYQPPAVPDNVIRADDDFSHLFPLPPDLVWPDPDMSTEVPSGNYITPPSGSGGGGGSASGGSAFNCSNAGMASGWGPNCGGAPRQRVLFQAPAASGHALATPGQSSYIYLSVHSRATMAFMALARICKDEGYVLKLGQCSSYNCRKVKRADGSYSANWSNHSWATAVDLNSRDLPQGRKAPAGHPVYRVAQRAVNLRTGSGKPVFRWGGTWSGSTADPMHFEVCCTAADVKTGIS